jgi:hypothetical protein
MVSMNAPTSFASTPHQDVASGYQDIQHFNNEDSITCSYNMSGSLIRNFSAESPSDIEISSVPSRIQDRSTQESTSEDENRRHVGQELWIDVNTSEMYENCHCKIDDQNLSTVDHLENSTMDDNTYDIFFIGDEVGELTLGQRDCGDNVDEEWLINPEDTVKADRQQHRMQKQSIQRTIVRGNRAKLRKLKAQLSKVRECDWIEQQKRCRNQVFKIKEKGDDYDFQDTQSPTCILDLPIPPHDVDDYYPDTPRYSNRFFVNEIPEAEVANPTSTRESRRRKKDSSYEDDPSEVRTMLPIPDATWYKNFFGSSNRSNTRREQQHATIGASTRSTMKECLRGGMSRLSNVTFLKEGYDQRKALELSGVLSEEEVLAIAGFKVISPHRAQC